MENPRHPVCSDGVLEPREIDHHLAFQIIIPLSTLYYTSNNPVKDRNPSMKFVVQYRSITVQNVFLQREPFASRNRETCLSLELYNWIER
jgi:hypothetical protein